MAAKKQVVKGRKKKVKKNIEKGQAHISSSFNNTIITLLIKEIKIAKL